MSRQDNKIFLIGILIFVWVAFTFAQGPDTLWTRTFGSVDDECGYSVQQTSDGGYIITGSTAMIEVQGDSGHAALIKTNAYGNIVWMRVYEEEELSKTYSVQQTSDGGYIITGSIGKVDEEDVYLVKTDSLGIVQWKKIFGGSEQDEGRSVQETFDGGYIVTGTKGGKVYLIKTDSSGDSVWTKTYGGSFETGGYSVQQTSDGGYIITGVTGSVVVHLDPGNMYLIKTDDKGSVTWTQSYGGADLDKGYSVQQTSDGGYIIAGYTESYGLTMMSEVYLIRTGPLGDTLWTKTYGEYFDDYGYSVQQTSDGGYIITGSTTTTDSSRTTSMDVYLIKTDASGETIWTKNVGGNDGDEGYSVQQTSDGGYIIAGYTKSFGVGNRDVYLIKTKPLFELVSPNGGEDWQGGSTHMITWSPENQPEDSYNFHLLFSSDGGNTYSDTIAKEIGADVQTWKWTVPLINSPNCVMKLELIDANDNVISEDVSDANFAIDISVPVIDSTTIWDDVSFSGPFEILTKATDNSSGIESVVLYYRRDEDPDWVVVTMDQSPGLPDWYVNMIPAVSSPVATVRYYIEAVDGAGYNATDPENAPTEHYSFTVNCTGVEEHRTLPSQFYFGLKSNPARGRAVFNLHIPTDAVITLRIYDVTGRLVDTPMTGRRSAGYYEISWDAEVSSGVYFYALSSPFQNKKGKLVLTR